ncbi:MAG: hemD [Gammaproteobacteria bacterium]|jgi:uroporphyrinogen-III synthase|nr:hemD [Gammaproteobacteria bacterium]
MSIPHNILALGNNDTLKALAVALPNRVLLFNPLEIVALDYPHEMPASVGKVILISANAVEYGLKIIYQQLSPKAQYFSIGKNTAKKAEALIQKNVYTPEIFNAESLLALSDLQQVEGQSILIIKGKGGRDILEKTLLARGAIVYTMDCYERRPKQIDLTNALKIWQNNYVQFLLIASEESLNAFTTQVDQAWLYSLTLIVTSERLEQIARNKGFGQILRAKHFTVEDILNTMGAYL